MTMGQQSLGLVMNRIEELRTLFQFGQQTLPLLSDFFQFLREIVPVLEGLNTSIGESMAKLPRATKELDKVTQATESATIEILDILDAVAEDIASVEGAVAGLKSAGVAPAQGEHLATIERCIREIGTRTGSIAIALQVQDITSQQVATVNHLVESVHKKLGSLLDGFSQIDFAASEPELQQTTQSLGFDANAVWTPLGERQALADALIRQHRAAETDGGHDGER
jgi:chemotaxis regulatin CheY-phosphate phosphatase CheZ